MSRGHEHDQLKYGLSLYISREKRPSNIETSFPAFSPTRPTRRMVRREPWERGCQTTAQRSFFPLQSYSKKA